MILNIFKKAIKVAAPNKLALPLNKYYCSGFCKKNNNNM